MSTSDSPSNVSTRPRTSKPRGVCKYYTTSRGCFAGDNCKFLHSTSADDPNQLTPFDQAKRCIFYQQGYCKRGDKCWFLHQLPHSESSTDTVEVDPCSICLEIPVTYGLLDGCSHVFCIDCIRQWRNSNTSNMTKRCPLCRTAFQLLVPHSHFHALGTPGRQAAVEAHRASCKRVKCRHFESSKAQLAAGMSIRRTPHCPFGRDCFYKHEDENGNEYVFSHGATDRDRSMRYGFFPTSFMMQPTDIMFDHLPTLFLGRPSPVDLIDRLLTVAPEVLVRATDEASRGFEHVFAVLGLLPSVTSIVTTAATSTAVVTFTTTSHDDGEGNERIETTVSTEEIDPESHTTPEEPPPQSDVETNAAISAMFSSTGPSTISTNTTTQFRAVPSEDDTSLLPAISFMSQLSQIPRLSQVNPVGRGMGVLATDSGSTQLSHGALLEMTAAGVHRLWRSDESLEHSRRRAREDERFELIEELGRALLSHRLTTELRRLGENMAHMMDGIMSTDPDALAEVRTTMANLINSFPDIDAIREIGERAFNRNDNEHEYDDMPALEDMESSSDEEDAADTTTGESSDVETRSTSDEESNVPLRAYDLAYQQINDSVSDEEDNGSGAREDEAIHYTGMALVPHADEATEAETIEEGEQRYQEEVMDHAEPASKTDEWEDQAMMRARVYPPPFVTDGRGRVVWSTHEGQPGSSSK